MSLAHRRAGQMPEARDTLLQFASGLPNAAGVILIALGGLCACGTGIMDEAGQTEPRAWLIPFAFLVPGVVMMFLGQWLSARAKAKSLPPPP